MYNPHFNPETNRVRPPVRYYGGKWRIAPWIISHFPPHTTYFEPFAGGASILFRKLPSTFEGLNDINGNIVNFFEVLRTRESELIRAIDLTPHSRLEHRKAHEDVTDGNNLERARRFYVRSRQSFGTGEGQWNSGWRYQVSNRRSSSVIDEWNTLEHLMWAARRLKLVQLECDDAFSAIARWDSPTTLMYVDPPYQLGTRYSNEQRYHTELSDEDHVKLAELLQKSDAMVILSSYESELYNTLYRDWTKMTKQTKTNGDHPATEVLWMNPEATAMNRLPLFSLGT